MTAGQAKDGYRLYDTHLQGAAVANTETLTGNKTLVDADAQVQFLDPGGASRDVTLPAEGDNNHLFFIVNTADAAENLVVKDDAANTIVTIGQSSSGIVASDGTSWKSTSGGGSAGSVTVQDFRLTLESGVPVSITDQLAKTTLYCTPYTGYSIGLDGSVLTSAEFSITNAGLGASAVYDVFVYNAVTPSLELLAWANTTTRATPLVYHATYKYLVKSGAETRRYMGTIMTDSANKFQIRFAGGVTAGAAAEVGVWNYYNRRRMRFSAYDNTDSWAYNTAAWRSWDNNTQNRINTLIGVQEDSVVARFLGTATIGAGATAVLGVGLDATNAIATDCINNGSSTATIGPMAATFDGFPGIGSHYLQLLEFGHAGGVTFFGDGAGTTLKHGGQCDVWA